MNTFFEIDFVNMIIHKKKFKLNIPPTLWPCGLLANWQVNPHPESVEKEKEMQEKFLEIWSKVKNYTPLLRFHFIFVKLSIRKFQKNNAWKDY